MIKLIATCSIVILCAMGVNSYLEIQSTDKVTAAIKEQDSVNQTITNNYDYSETNNYYENNDNDEKVKELEDKVNKLEETKEKEENEQVLVTVDKNNVVRYEQQSTSQEPWRGPKSYKCNYMAGYPAICGYCGERGEIHFNIIEWMDDNMTYHLTHLGCADAYCNKNNVQPRMDQAYKIRK